MSSKPSKHKRTLKPLGKIQPLAYERETSKMIKRLYEDLGISKSQTSKKSRK